VGVVSADAESIFDWMTRLVEARKCCGTCAGGVIADRDRLILAGERERIAQAIEAARDDRYNQWRDVGLNLAAAIARNSP
jgi:hypothetical protein